MRTTLRFPMLRFAPPSVLYQPLVETPSRTVGERLPPRRKVPLSAPSRESQPSQPREPYPNPKPIQNPCRGEAGGATGAGGVRVCPAVHAKQGHRRLETQFRHYARPWLIGSKYTAHPPA